MLQIDLRHGKPIECSCLFGKESLVILSSWETVCPIEVSQWVSSVHEALVPQPSQVRHDKIDEAVTKLFLTVIVTCLRRWLEGLIKLNNI